MTEILMSYIAEANVLIAEMVTDLPQEGNIV